MSKSDQGLQVSYCIITVGNGYHSLAAWPQLAQFIVVALPVAVRKARQSAQGALEKTEDKTKQGLR